MNISAKSTKDQLLKAYQELAKEKKNVEAQLRQKERELAQSQAELNRCEAQVAKLQLLPNPSANNGNGKATELPASPKAAKPDFRFIMHTLEQTELDLGLATSELSAQMTNEADKLAELRQAIATRQGELKELYQTDIQADTLDKLIDEYEQTEESFAETFRKERETAEEALQEAQKAWRKEIQQYQKQIRERDQATHKSQAREYETYRYDLEHARNLELDSYQQKKKQLASELAELRETHDQQWAEREKTLKLREDEAAKFQQEAEELPKKIEAEVKKAEAETRAAIEKDARLRAELAARESAAQAQMANLKIQALQASVESRNVQIDNLRLQIAHTLRQVQELALKAIEGSANLDKFNAVKEIANELAKNQPKSNKN